MTESQLIPYCLQKPGAFACHPFGPDVVVVKVRAPGGPARIFAQFFVLNGEKKATFNCDMMTGEFYRRLYPGAVSRGYHCPPVQQPYFNTVSLNGTVPGGELLRMADHAYSAVLAKLPKKYRRELEATTHEA